MFQQHKGIFLVIIGVLLLAISPWLPVRWDLSQDKKFTLSETSIQTIREVDAPLRIKIYLGGKSLPGGFKRLEKALNELLADLQTYSSQGITIEHVDVYDLYPEGPLRQKIIFELDSLGIPPTNIVNNEDGKQVQQLIFPGLLIEKGDASVGVLLLKGNSLASPQEVLNQSMEGIEYEIIQAIRSLSSEPRKKIGFFLDHSHVPAVRQLDLIASLRKSYDLYPVDLSASMTLEGLDAICVIQPDTKFTELDQFKIDQFIVKGGKAIFFSEGIRVDTVVNQGLVATPLQTGLEKLIYRYGIRINANWVKDATLCGAIPLAVGNFGNKPSLELMPWPAFPLLNGNPKTSITRNLDAVYGKFVSSLDTIKGNPYLRKTALLSTSQYTQVQNTPATLPFSSSGNEFNPAKFKDGPQVISYLVEGRFKSAFRNRILPSDSLIKGFLAESTQTSAIIVVGDGDIPLNGINPSTKGPLALGFDPFSKHNFANKDFVLNAMHYLLDDGGAVMARNKTVTLRPLDKVKIKEKKTFFQLINLLVPIGLAILVSIFIIMYRKHQYNH